MKSGGLTEKKMQNKKFQKTENAIFLAYYKFRDFKTAKTLARRAGISRQTLYRHHKTPERIPENYEKYLLEVYSKTTKKFLNQKDISHRKIYFRMLIFIYNNQIIFGALFRDGRKEIIKSMINITKKQILNEWNYAGADKKFFKVYQNEILGLIESWSEKDFKVSELENILNDILYLNKYTPKHLARFLETS